MFSRKLFFLLSIFVVLALVLVACGGTEEAAPTEAPAEAPTEAPAEEEPMEEEAPAGGEFAGETVTIFTAAGEAQIKILAAPLTNRLHQGNTDVGAVAQRVVAQRQIPRQSTLDLLAELIEGPGPFHFTAFFTGGAKRRFQVPKLSARRVQNQQSHRHRQSLPGNFPLLYDTFSHITSDFSHISAGGVESAVRLKPWFCM